MADTNVWLALAAERHEHHRVVADWFASLGEQEAAFCRITQMGLLRLLCNAAVMGEDVRNAREAWRAYENLRADWRVKFAGEPLGFEETWVKLVDGAGGSGVWTDAYLAAFALGHRYTLVSFDRGFRRWKELWLRTPAGAKGAR